MDSEEKITLTSFSNELADAVARVGEAVVSIHARPRVPCSGVLWREGVIVSCDHTVRRDEEINVTLADGRRVVATLAGRDHGTDLAVLKLENPSPVSVPLGDASSLRVGHLVLALGRTDERGVTASYGIIGSLGGRWRTWRGGELDNLIRPDLAVYLGFSGGPLVDTAGRILGINTTGLARSAGLTIPTATVNRVVEAILERGSVGRGYLGITLQPVALPAALRARLHLEAENGAIILSVEPSGPAGQGGLMIGDVLLTVDGHQITDTSDLQSLLGPESVGREMRATYIRAGEPAETSLKIAERPRRSR